MGDLPDQPTGVVLDEVDARALLYAAVQEGLADGDPLIGDGFVANILRTPPSQARLDRALEQIVVGGKVWLPFRLPEDWRGELFESGAVQSSPHVDEAEELFEQIDGDFILEMLRDRGHPMTPDEYDGILHRLHAAYEHWRNLTDQSLMAFTIQRAVQQMLSRRHHIPSELDRAADELSLANADAQPIIDCVNTFTKVVGSALKLHALSSLPFRAVAGKLVPTYKQPDDVRDRLVSINVVCRELRTIPRAADLRKTLKLAQSDEAEALRRRLTEWSGCVRCGDDRLQLVKDEVAYAQRQLAAARTWGVAGSLYTVVAIPISMLDSVSPVVASALNWTVNVGSVIALTAATSIYRQNLWAMIGSVQLDD